MCVVDAPGFFELVFEDDDAAGRVQGGARSPSSPGFDHESELSSVPPGPHPGETESDQAQAVISLRSPDAVISILRGLAFSATGTRRVSTPAL